MGLADSIASALAGAYLATGSIQEAVIHEPWVGQDKNTGSQYGPGVALTALVQEGGVPVRRESGEVITTKARLGFLVPIAPNGAPDRQEPIDPRDRFTLASGLVGKILEVRGVLGDPSTGRPMAHSVWLV